MKVSGKFWRAATRKFYAIRRREREREDKGKGKKRASRIFVDSSSDTDDFLPIMDVTKKKRQCGGSGASSSNFATIKDEIHAIRQDMQCFHQIDKRMKIPTSLYRALSDTFKCKICQRAPIIPPVIFARCCKSILGCRGCIDTWYKGEDGIS